MPSTEDPDGLAAVLQEWFTMEDTKLVQMDEIEIALEEQQHSEDNQTILCSDSPVADSETHSDVKEIDEESIQLNCKNEKGAFKLQADCTVFFIVLVIWSNNGLVKLYFLYAFSLKCGKRDMTIPVHFCISI